MTRGTFKTLACIKTLSTKHATILLIGCVPSTQENPSPSNSELQSLHASSQSSLQPPTNPQSHMQHHKLEGSVHACMKGKKEKKMKRGSSQPNSPFSSPEILSLHPLEPLSPAKKKRRRGEGEIPGRRHPLVYKFLDATQNVICVLSCV